MELPDSVAISAIASLSLTIAYMARLMYARDKGTIADLKASDIANTKEIAEGKSQAAVMKADIRRLKGGCGVSSCLWKNNT